MIDIDAVESRDDTGRKLIHYAAMYGNLKVFAYLIDEMGVDFNAKTSDGKTPIDIATEYGHENILEFLLYYKAIDEQVKDDRNGFVVERLWTDRTVRRRSKRFVEFLGSPVRLMGDELSEALALCENDVDELIAIQDALDGKRAAAVEIGRNRHFLRIITAFDAINSNYATIIGVIDEADRNYGANRNIDNELMRNFDAIRKVISNVDRKLTSIQSSFTMIGIGLDEKYETVRAIGNGNYNVSVKSIIPISNEFINKSRIEPILVSLLSFSEYFTTEKNAIRMLDESNRIAILEDSNGVLYHLKDAKSPMQHYSLYSILNDLRREYELTNRTNTNDKTTIIITDLMYYGLRTLFSVMSFVLEQYSSSLAETYYRRNEFEKFNHYVSLFLSNFDSFYRVLTTRIDNVISALQQIQEFDHDRQLTSSKIAFLIELQSSLDRMHRRLHADIYRHTPPRLELKLDFSRSLVSAPIGEWIDRRKVSYAIQYVSSVGYSRVSAWSNAYTVFGRANPTLTLPTIDSQSDRIRLIFRKFDNTMPELVAIIEHTNQTTFIDIDKDLYNAASGANVDLAIDEMQTLLVSGANFNVKFGGGRQAIHAAAIGDNVRVALALIRNGSDVNARDANGYAPMHLAALTANDDFIAMLIDNGADINAQTKLKLTPLHISAFRGDEAIVRRLLMNDTIDVNARTVGNYTALHYATAANRSRIVDLFVDDDRVDVNAATSPGGFTSIHIAAAFGYHDIVARLIDSDRIDVNVQSNQGLTPFHLASIAGAEHVAFELLKSAKVDINAKSRGNLTALHLTVAVGNPILNKLIIEQAECDINAMAVDSITPLQLSIASKQQNISLQMLTAKNISLQGDGAQLTPLQLAVITSQRDVVFGLLKKEWSIIDDETEGDSLVMEWSIMDDEADDNLTALHFAVMYDDDGRMVSTLLSYFAETNTKGNLAPIYLAIVYRNRLAVDNLLPNGTTYANNFTLLHFASAVGDLDIVLSLIRYYDLINIDILDNEQRTPLYVALQYDHIGVVRTLMNNSADIGIRLTNNRTLLHLAVNRGDDDAVRCILDNSMIAVNVKDNYGWQPLHDASNSGQTAICLLLIKNRARVDAKCKWRNQTEPDIEAHLTPLQLAASNGHNDTVMSLLDFGADINARCNYYDDPLGSEPSVTALHLAARAGHASVVYALIARGANVTVEDKYGHTPIQLAARYGNTEALLVLFDNSSVDIVNETDELGNTLLHYAASYGHLTTVFALFDKGADVNAIGENDDTPMHLAAANGHTNVVLALLKKGANIHAIGKLGQLPLHSSVRNGHTDTMLTLLANGADINAIGKFGQTAINLAAYNGHTDTVLALINAGAAINTASTYDISPLHYDAISNVQDAELYTMGAIGRMPIHYAASQGHVQTILALIVKGANVNSPDRYRNTPLHYAAANGHTGAVLALIDSSANVNSKGSRNNTALHSAARNGHTQTILVLLGKGAGMNDSVVYDAIKYGRKEKLLALFDRIADVNARDEIGNTPLHWAAFNGYNETVAILLDNDADISARDKYDNTALYKAAENGHTETVVTLIERGGADVNAKNYQHLTPLLVAARNGHKETVIALLDSGADANATTVSGDTAIHLSSSNNHKETILTLLAKGGANVNAKDRMGDRPLHKAARHGHTETVFSLLDNGADINAKGDNSNTALHHAALHGHRDTVVGLIDRGADINAMNSYHETALYYAILNKHNAIVRALLEGGADTSTIAFHNRTKLGQRYTWRIRPCTNTISRNCLPTRKCDAYKPCQYHFSSAITTLLLPRPPPHR